MSLSSLPKPMAESLKSDPSMTPFLQPSINPENSIDAEYHPASIPIIRNALGTERIEMERRERSGRAWRMIWQRRKRHAVGAVAIATAAVAIRRIGETRQRSIVVPSPSKRESTNGARSASLLEWYNVF